MNKKIVFMGTPEFSVPVLDMLNEKYNVVLVVTQADKEVGKKKELTFSPVKKYAIEHNIPVFQPEKLRNDYEIISEVNPDLIVTCAYGQILSEDVLNIPRLGCINVHASLLPKYRGASPMQYAILNNEKTTGVTIMYMDKGMDTGDIISQRSIDISKEDDLGTIHDKLSMLGKNLLEDIIDSIFDGTNKREKQDNEKATYCKLIKREDELLDFNDNVINVFNKIRAFSPYPLSYFVFENNEIKIIKADYEEKDVSEVGKVIISKNEMNITCKDGIIKLLRIKPFGKKEMDVKAFLNGRK